jgi:large subunit ribosomal protein L17
MAGAARKYRHLSRTSSHRQALLRNLVTSLFEHESISTTWPKAKEAQRLAEKLVTMGKKNTEASRRRATQIFYVRLPPLSPVPSPNSLRCPPVCPGS